VLFGVFFDTLNPLVNLGLFKFLEALAERVVKLLYVFELFTLLN
jgi:hypothetical protein